MHPPPSAAGAEQNPESKKPPPAHAEGGLTLHSDYALLDLNGLDGAGVLAGPTVDAFFLVDDGLAFFHRDAFHRAFRHAALTANAFILVNFCCHTTPLLLLCRSLVLVERSEILKLLTA
jgi:hypothetical protein